MYKDLHSHILFDIDDGPADLEQSLELAKAAVTDGITHLVATPHFYGTRHSLEERRGKMLRYTEALNSVLAVEQLPLTVLPGFEVRYFDGISKSDDLDKLCIASSKVLLLELGLINVTDSVIEEIIELGYRGYMVVLAHIERYSKLKGFKYIKRLIEERKVIAQLTSAAFVNGVFLRPALKILKGRGIVILSTDMHSVDERPPLLTPAYEFITNKFGEDFKNRIVNNSERIFSVIL